MTLQANLTNRDATRMPHPLVKWSYEPPRAEDVPHALARGIHPAAAARAGLRLRPDGRLGRRGGRRRRGTSWGAASMARAALERSPRARRAAGRRREPGAGGGPGGGCGGGLGRRGRAGRAAAAPCVGDPRHRRRPDRIPREPPGLFQGILPPAVGPLAETLEGTTSCSSSAPRSSLTTRTSPARCCRGRVAGGDHERPR